MAAGWQFWTGRGAITSGPAACDPAAQPGTARRPHPLSRATAAAPVPPRRAGASPVSIDWGDVALGPRPVGAGGDARAGSSGAGRAGASPGGIPAARASGDGGDGPGAGGGPNGAAGGAYA